jgi:hypothetical protein
VPVDKQLFINSLRDAQRARGANFAARARRRAPRNRLWEPFESLGIAGEIPWAPIGIAQEPAAAFVDADGRLPGNASQFRGGKQGIQAKKTAQEKREERSRNQKSIPTGI